MDVLVPVLFLQLHTFGLQHFRRPLWMYGKGHRLSGNRVVEERFPVFHLGLGRVGGYGGRFQIHRDWVPLWNAESPGKKSAKSGMNFSTGMSKAY